MLPRSGRRKLPTSLRVHPCCSCRTGATAVVRVGELVMIMELHRQGLSLTAIGRQLGIDRKTVRRYIALGLEPPTYGPRPPRQRSTDPRGARHQARADRAL